MTHGGLIIEQFELGPMENFVYFLACSEEKKALVVDPAWQVDTIKKKALELGLDIEGALITHHHYDHTNGIEALLNAFDCKVYINKHDAEFVDVPKMNLVKTDQGDVIEIGQQKIEVLHTPGHTPGSQSFLCQDHLITGDTLFIDGCGRCDLPGGDPEKMYYTLTQKIMMLPEHTCILPGHDYGQTTESTLSRQKKSNPYLRMAQESLEDFVKLRMRPRR